MKKLEALYRFSFVGLMVSCLALAGCGGDEGKTETSGAANTGIVTGAVTNAGTTPPQSLSGATVSVDPAIPGVSITTDANGRYSATLPIGFYTLTYTATYFVAQTETVSLVAGQKVTQDVALVPTAPVIVSINITGDAVPGATLNATATTTIMDGSTLASTTWSQSNSVPVDFGTPDAATTTFGLPDTAAYKEELLKVIADPPITADQLPPNVPVPPTPFPAGLQDRFQVQGINNFQMEEAGLVTLTMTVETSSGVYTGTKAVNTELPWHVNPGINNVPMNQPVLVHGGTLGGTQTAWAWSLTGPADSTATLDDPAAQNPAFTPDVTGQYTLDEADSGASIVLFAGTFEGVIDAAQTLSADGKVVARSACTACHAPTASPIAPDIFTPWIESGHSTIFTDNLNGGSSGHYGDSCFACHTVGFNQNAANSGFDDVDTYTAFLDQFFPADDNSVRHPAGGSDNWIQMLTDFPNVAQLSNAQCESCHGPQNSGGAHTTGTPRVSISAEVCGSCHGEPARHGRYQQWQLSGHANYEVALGEGFSGSPPAIRTTCAGCHTGQGALAWFDQLARGNPSRTLDATSLAALGGVTPENVHPQSCAVCHDPHNAGTVSGDANNATVRISGSTPMLPAGFQALGVGKGAMCLTCHNSRNGESSGQFGLHEDDDPLWGTLAGFSAVYSAPHEACQGDVLMGRNAYFVQGVRAGHSNILNTCTNCHMQKTDPPAVLSYNLSGTNHTFAPSRTICSQCHNGLDADGVQTAVETELAELKSAVEAAIVRLYSASLGGATTVSYSAGRSPTVTYDDGTTEVTVNLKDLAPFSETLAKANWNYSLISEDRSEGVHNPSFAHSVLFATTQAVDAL